MAAALIAPALPAVPVTAAAPSAQAAPAKADAAAKPSEAKSSFAGRLQQAQGHEAPPADAAKRADKPDGKPEEAKKDDDGDAPLDLSALLHGWHPPVPRDATPAASGAKAESDTDAAVDELDAATDAKAKALPFDAASAKPGRAHAAARHGADDKTLPLIETKADRPAPDLARDERAITEATSAKAAPATSAHQAPLSAAPGALAAAEPGAKTLESNTVAPASFEARLSAAMNTPEFGPALGVQVSILVREGVQEARLHLNPAEMGPIAVQIAVDGTQAQVHFQADVAATRDALQSSMNDLAAALREGGFTLSGGGVSDSRREAHHGQQAGGNAGSSSLGDDNSLRAAPARAQAVRTQGVVDLYA
jgi:flagellar hook-length control protein FliK